MTDAPTDSLAVRTLRAVGSAVFWTFVLLSSLICYPLSVVVWAVTAPFDPRKRWLHLFSSAWASLYTWFNPAWNVSIEGREHLDSDEARVLVANHLSLVDIIALYNLFTHFKWVSKIENFRVPLIGWNMTLNGYIPLIRGNRASIVDMMRRCEAALAMGSSVLIFPEGTRSQSGRLRAFKTGAFELALKARVPLQPIVIQGSGDALPKRGAVLQGIHDIRVRVLPAIPYPEFADLSAEDFAEQVRDRIADVQGATA